MEKTTTAVMEVQEQYLSTRRPSTVTLYPAEPDRILEGQHCTVQSVIVELTQEFIGQFDRGTRFRVTIEPVD